MPQIVIELPDDIDPTNADGWADEIETFIESIGGQFDITVRLEPTAPKTQEST